MDNLNTRVPLNFNVVAGRESSAPARVVDRERLFALLPLVDDEVERIINRIIHEIVSTVNTASTEYPYSADIALQQCYKIAAMINLRNEFRVSAALDPTGKPL